jgi:hypothetical protein
MLANDKDRSRSASLSKTDTDRTTYEIDPILVALRQVYGRILAEPLPQRLAALAKRFTGTHA